MQAGLKQAALHLLYPPQCLGCGALVTTDFGLCGPCWRDTPFISGLVCDQCGVTLPGQDPGHALQCDDCLTLARPWLRGRAALLYHGGARALVLKLKHADRTDLAAPLSGWLHRAAAPILRPDMLVVPVPLHWWRLFRRRYNQAALLADGLARRAGLTHCPDLLLRTRATGTQDGRGRAAGVRRAPTPQWPGARSHAVAFSSTSFTPVPRARSARSPRRRQLASTTTRSRPRAPARGR